MQIVAFPRMWGIYAHDNIIGTWQQSLRGDENMAARLTDKQKKKIIADYVEVGSFNAAVRANGVSRNTVKAVVTADNEVLQKAAQKKEQNTVDMLAYMEKRKKDAQGVIDGYLKALADPNKIEMAKLSEVATAMGIVIDKFVNTPIKNQLDRQKLELEIVKVESQIKDNQPEEEAEDGFMDALNAVADDVWEDSQEKE